MPGQSKLKVDPAIGRKFTFTLNRCAVFAEIDQSRRDIFNIPVVQSHLGVSCDPTAAPSLTLHQGPGRPEAAPGPVLRNRFVKDEVDAQGKHLPHVIFFARDRYRQAGLVQAVGAGAAQDFCGLALTLAINHDGIETLLGKLETGLCGCPAMLDRNAEFFQNAAQHLGRRFVCTHYEAGKRHTVRIVKLRPRRDKLPG